MKLVYKHFPSHFNHHFNTCLIFSRIMKLLKESQILQVKEQNSLFYTFLVYAGFCLHLSKINFNSCLLFRKLINLI